MPNVTVPRRVLELHVTRDLSLVAGTEALLAEDGTTMLTEGSADILAEGDFARVALSAAQRDLALLVTRSSNA